MTLRHLHWYVLVLFEPDTTQPVGWFCRTCLRALNQIEMNQFYREAWHRRALLTEPER